jgi:hypothetical protein
MFYSRVVIDIATSRVLAQVRVKYAGPVAWCKGATDQQNQLEASQSAFYSTLTQDYSKQFANQQNVLNSLKAAWAPVLAAGPGQYGFTAAEDTALRTEATQGTANSYQQAQKALNNQFAARSGGDTYLPSGTEAQLNSTVASNAANQISSENLGITTAGYDRGYNLFQAASNVLGGVAGQYNPTGYSSSANTAGSDAASTANQIQQADAASSPWGAIGGILGGAAGAFTGGLGSGIGGAVGKKIGG